MKCNGMEISSGDLQVQWVDEMPQGMYLVNGYRGSRGYPQVASMAPWYRQTRHCEAHGKTPLAARGAG